MVGISELVVGTARTIVVLGEIGPETLASPRTALQWTAHMGSGSIALISDRYFVRIAVPIDQIDVAPWTDLVRYAGTLASELAAELSSTRRRQADVSCLAHYGG